MARTPVITAECTLSYPNLFTPRETPSGEEKFGCALIFDAAADLSELKAAARAAAEARWGDKAKAMLRDKSIRWPFRDGAEKSGRGYGPGTVFLNVSTTRAPGIVGRYAGPDGRPKPISDADELYPGCKVRASLVPFAYDTSGNRGVSFLLNNIQKLGEGERLDGRLDAEDEFDVWDDDEPVDLERVDEGDPDLGINERLRGQAARMQRRRLRQPRDDADGTPWDDAAA